MADASIVIPARNEGPLLTATLTSLARTPAGATFDVVVVDDGSAPPVAPLPVAGLQLRYLRGAGFGAAGARNRGAAAATADVLCFCDAHVAFAPGWLRALLETLEQWDAVSPAIANAEQPRLAGYGFTWTPSFQAAWLPRPPNVRDVPFLPGACLTVRRTAFDAVRGFDDGLQPWGHEDVEISLALWTCGYSCAVRPDVAVAHHFRQRHPYLVLREEVDRNLLRVGCVHLSRPRLQRLAGVLSADQRDVAAVSAAAAGRRMALTPSRRRDDEWLCERFALPV